MTIHKTIDSKIRIFMKIQVVYFGPFRDITEIKEEYIEFQNNKLTVNDLLVKIVQKYGEKMKSELFFEGMIHEHLHLLLNGQDIRTLSNLATPLNDGNRVAIFFAIGGG